MGLILAAKGVPSLFPFGLGPYFLLMLSGIDPKSFFYTLGFLWEFLGRYVCCAETIQAHMMMTNIRVKHRARKTGDVDHIYFLTDSLDLLFFFILFSVTPSCFVTVSVFLLLLSYRVVWPPLSVPSCACTRKFPPRITSLLNEPHVAPGSRGYSCLVNMVILRVFSHPVAKRSGACRSVAAHSS